MVHGAGVQGAESEKQGRGTSHSPDAMPQGTDQAESIQQALSTQEPLGLAILAAVLLRGPSSYLAAPVFTTFLPSRWQERDGSQQPGSRIPHSLSSLPSSSEPSHRSPVIFLPLHRAILLNISKKYSLTPSLFIYKNQLNTLLLCSIWILEQPDLYLAEIPLLSPQIPAQPRL